MQEIYFGVETDKATIDVEAADDGKLWEILVNEGPPEYQLVSHLPFSRTR